MIDTKTKRIQVSDLRKLLQERIERTNPRRSLTAEDRKLKKVKSIQMVKNFEIRNENRFSIDEICI